MGSLPDSSVRIGRASLKRDESGGRDGSHSGQHTACDDQQRNAENPKVGSRDEGDPISDDVAGHTNTSSSRGPGRRWNTSQS